MLGFSKIDKDFLIYKNSKVYLFGAGRLGKRCKNILEKQGICISGFIDNGKEKQGTEFCNIRVLSFEDFMKIAKQYKNTVIQISSQYEREMIEQIEEGGYENYISWSEFCVRTRQWSMYMETKENIELKKLIYKCDIYGNLRAPVLALIKNNYFGRKVLLGRGSFDIMLSAFTVGNHAIGETYDGKGMVALNHSYKWMDEKIWEVLKNGEVRVVIGVGDPIAQNISLMYQICENDFWDMDEFWEGGVMLKRYLMNI